MAHFLQEAFFFLVCVGMLIASYCANIHLDNRREDREARQAAREMEWKKLNGNP